jgi:citrate synthase
MSNSNYHPGLEPFIKAFPKHTHPMAMMTTLMAALSSFYPEANPAYVGPNIYKEKEERDKHMIRVLGCAPTIAAACYRHRLGLQAIEPDKNADYIQNFWTMLKSGTEKYQNHPKVVRAIEILFVLHAEHELNCSTAAIRHMASSQADVYTSLAGAVTALYGPRHGGANEAVLRMLESI